ncbi:MAG: uridine kinase [Alphaproteobacteria bacterium]
MSRDAAGRIWTAGLDNVFAGQTTSNVALYEAYADVPQVRVLPDVWIVKIGGQSIMDRGRAAVFPIIEELIQARDEGIQYVLGTGGGTRARHVYALGLDLELPTGMLAKLGSGVPVQNARMLQMLMARNGGIVVYHDDFEKLPLYLKTGCIPITSGMPPFEFWEKSPDVGRLPANRTDAGMFLLAEFLGARGVLFVKDEPGLFTADPKKDPKATLIPEASAEDLLASGQDDLIVERVVLEYMTRARHMREIRIVNGLERGQVLAALRGEPVGSVIRSRGRG